MQSTHSEFEKEKHDFDIVVLCDALESPANIGGVLRLADAYGVSEVVFFEGINSLTTRAKSVSRGTQKYVNHHFLSKHDFDEREWFCLELTSSSVALSEFKAKGRKIGVIIGNENLGVRQAFLDQFPSYHIKMFGNNSSMNVTNALSGALYQLTN